MSFRTHSGFTLIELLIVVAIIGILAAIAIPNFLEAQVRAKVARARSDMASSATAAEIYRVDFDNYPPMRDYPSVWGTPGYHARLPGYLTSPISYISDLPDDPFIEGDPGKDYIDYEWRYVYWNWDEFHDMDIDGGTTGDHPGERAAGKWLMYSYGPDRDWTNGLAASLCNTWINYDSSNGTISKGNIFRTMRDPTGIRWWEHPWCAP